MQSLFAFGQAAFASPEAPRLFRALAQYQAALRYWNTGSRVLVLAHLYIACEVLTKAVQRVNQARLGLTEQQHAQLLGVDISQKNWQMMAENFTRREYIFEGDRLTYDTARKASTLSVLTRVRFAGASTEVPMLAGGHHPGSAMPLS